MFPGVQIMDLYQNPDARPRKGEKHVPALTTGCARMYMTRRKRIARGAELLLLHGIPVTVQASLSMQASLINVDALSHRAQCALAGNSMHCACVGLMAFATLFLERCNSQ